ncbi:MAG TPA: class I SAM-dependent methyltransferase [Candidatus Rubrimentiphilum sp.]|nr:class I SAM-dependent methyltransferase [Candidatus Rubrimentiphilum sp.]
MSSRSFMIPEEVYEYIARVTVRDDSVQQQLTEQTQELPDARMQTGRDQLQLLQLLVRTIGARHCIEVGVFTGASALAVALALPQDGRIIACDVSEEYTAIARRYWAQANVAQKIDLRLAPATQTLDALIAQNGAGRYDFAYVDADKSNYDAYYERLLQLLRAGGLMALDNMLWHGAVADPTQRDEETVALRNLNEKIGKDERVDCSLISIGDGLMLVRKR